MALRTPRIRTDADSPLDAIARGLAGGMSRRDALRMGGAALVGVAGLTPAAAWAAATGQCPKGHVKCAGKCCPIGEVCLPAARPGGTPHCGCPHHLTRCSGRCVNLHTNANHCGSCAHRCPAGQHCANGVCACPSGETNCSGVCVNLNTSAQHCGSCANACPTGDVCQGGQCVPLQCPTGETNCNGKCVNTQTDVNNCGTCGTACSSYFAVSSCQSGTCHIDSCSPNWINCSGDPRDGCNCLGTTCNGKMCG